MKLKVRGYEADFLNNYMQDRDYDIFVGCDIEGNEVYTGDTVIDTQSGGEYKVDLELALNFLPFESCISNFKLKNSSHNS